MNRQSKDLIAYLLSKFEIKLESIVLIKLVYLSEIEAIEKYGKRFTDLKFIHYKHGPYANELHDSYESNMFTSFNIEGKDPDLLGVVETVVNKWKPIITGVGIQGLINKTYHTLPFQETSFNEEIDFKKYIGNKYISKTVVSKKKYKTLSNPNIKLYSGRELQSSVDEFLEQFKSLSCFSEAFA
jgi:hypothetical protein